MSWSRVLTLEKRLWRYSSFLNTQTPPQPLLHHKSIFRVAEKPNIHLVKLIPQLKSKNCEDAFGFRTDCLKKRTSCLSCRTHTGESKVAEKLFTEKKNPLQHLKLGQSHCTLCILICPLSSTLDTANGHLRLLVSRASTDTPSYSLFKRTRQAELEQWLSCSWCQRQR